MATEIPHFTLPFRWERSSAGGVAAAVAEQESIEEIGACCEAIIRTVEGQRTTLPDFGRPELEFNTDPEWVRTVLAGALQEWEPRVAAILEAEPDPDDTEAQLVRALLAPADDQEGEQV